MSFECGEVLLLLQKRQIQDVAEERGTCHTGRGVVLANSKMAFFSSILCLPKPGVPNTSRWQQICSWKLPGLVVLLILRHNPHTWRLPPVTFLNTSPCPKRCCGLVWALSHPSPGSSLPPTARACTKDTSAMRGFM